MQITIFFVRNIMMLASRVIRGKKTEEISLPPQEEFDDIRIEERINPMGRGSAQSNNN